MDALRDTLNCCICTELVNLPVHPVCCEKTQSMSCACLSCVREYLELNRSNNQRIKMRKSWTGCGCNINLQSKSSKYLYKHTLQLDQIRNLFGPSKCHHQECGLEFDTAAELRRHITGTANNYDKHGNCKYSMTQCKYCNFYAQRHIIEGEHFRKFHSFIHCDVCSKDIRREHITQHYTLHMDDIKKLYLKIDKIRSEY